ncbi:pantothenate synthetase [Propionigenium maris DSM 9537]|uniref:Pantothenate synthetase n=1 Tax=Propionigenium maris DSM 9537 TaxID=1123000 RepID=A0A9W6GJ35_9FUSO|nr:pantoate--beta-alanine ligase [Propionigenium maris]GLI54597.1 pantothenate synthetase [Propionigenium maris DSM 9537]
MKVAEMIGEVRKIVESWRKEGLSVGLVPTMGYLHLGHESLIEKAVEENDRVVVTIFVNPAQFDRAEDLENYPVKTEEDLKIIEKIGGALVFLPDATEIYPEGFNTVLEVEELDKELCGATRPGHFRGVCTIVNKLFNIVGPTRAYFGEKDYQQLAIIRRMVTDLNMPVEIIGCPIVRDEDGLALSSRNARLSADKREKALILSRTLRELKERVAEGERETSKLIRWAIERIEKVPQARVDYFEVVDRETLQRLDVVESGGVVAAAVFIGKVRLIDNILVG